MFLLLDLFDFGGKGVSLFFFIAHGFDPEELGLLLVGGADLGDHLLGEEAAAGGVVVGWGEEGGPGGFTLGEVEEQVKFRQVGRKSRGDAGLNGDGAGVADEGFVEELPVLRVASGDVYP